MQFAVFVRILLYLLRLIQHFIHRKQERLSVFVIFFV